MASSLTSLPHSVPFQTTPELPLRLMGATSCK